MTRTLIILTPGFPSDENDTTCLPPQQLLIRALQEVDPQLNIIVLSFQYPFTSKAYFWNGIKIIPFNGRNRGKLIRLAVWVKVWATFRRKRGLNNIVGILSFWCTECALVGKYLGKYYSTKQHCWILGQDAKKENKYVRLIRPKPTELIAMSGFLQHQFNNSHGVKPGYVIHNGIDPRLFPARFGKRDIDILGVGSLIKLKQWDVFLNIAGDLIPTFPSINALILGKGPEEIFLSSIIGNRSLQDNVSLAGEIPHAQVLENMTRTKVLLHTSIYEGFSTVCLEALFAGAHVVSFCDPIEGVTSHWHIVNTEEEMLGKLIQLLGDENLDHTPQMPFSMIDSAKSMLKLYE